MNRMISQGQAWWYTTVILMLERLSQEDLEFKASLGYIVRPYFNTPLQKMQHGNISNIYC
jgi:hypothetical protein